MGLCLPRCASRALAAGRYGRHAVCGRSGRQRVCAGQAHGLHPLALSDRGRGAHGHRYRPPRRAGRARAALLRRFDRQSVCPGRSGRNAGLARSPGPAPQPDPDRRAGPARGRAVCSAVLAGGYRGGRPQLRVLHLSGRRCRLHGRERPPALERADHRQAAVTRGPQRRGHGAPGPLRGAGVEHAEYRCRARSALRGHR